MKEPTQDIFLKDVAEHQMTIVRASGVERYLRFRKPDNGNMWFDILTWPQTLVIDGDMGTWVFSRVEDMFKFFRGRRGERLEINPSYWAEKLRLGVHGGRDCSEVWDDEGFKAGMERQLTEYYSLEGEELVTVRDRLVAEVFCYDGEFELWNAAYDFACMLPDREFSFDSSELPSGKVYSYHFIWCLYAIVWAIQQWDKNLVEEG